MVILDPQVVRGSRVIQERMACLGGKDILVNLAIEVFLDNQAELADPCVSKLVEKFEI